MNLSNKNLKLREETPKDKSFLLKLYSDTRHEEIANTILSEQQKKVFLKSQFEAQFKHYHENYVDASYQLILFKKKAIGRIYIDRNSKEIRLIDISLLSSHRGRKIGSDFIKALIGEANKNNKVLTLHVWFNSRARQLYQRLGFKEAGENNGHVFMRYEPKCLAVN